MGWLQVFGFQRVESPKFEFDVIWLKLEPSFYLHLIERDPTTKLPEGPWSSTSAVADPKHLPRGHHICFSVSNFDSFVQAVKVGVYICCVLRLFFFYYFLSLIFCGFEWTGYFDEMNAVF